MCNAVGIQTAGFFSFQREEGLSAKDALMAMRDDETAHTCRAWTIRDNHQEERGVRDDPARVLSLYEREGMSGVVQVRKPSYSSGGITCEK